MGDHCLSGLLVNGDDPCTAHVDEPPEVSSIGLCLDDHLLGDKLIVSRFFSLALSSLRFLIIQSIVLHLQPEEVGSVVLYGGKLDLRLDSQSPNNGLWINNNIDDIHK